MIDFRVIPEVKSVIDYMEKDDNDMHLPAVGQRIKLDIEVKDPRLMQIVLGSIFSDKAVIGVPGAKIHAAAFDGDRQVIKDWLRSALEKLEASDSFVKHKSCGKKVTYDQKIAFSWLKEKGQSAYRCSYCNGWHLASK